MKSDPRPRATDPTTSVGALRERAESILRRRPAKPHQAPADLLQVVHELQVHQIELELQNEALVQSERQARESLQRLDELHAHLERKVAERTADLAQAREAAESANRAKSAFLSNMSHELRTPLNGVMGMVSLALLSATDARQVDWLHKANRAARHLLSILNDVLDLSKIEAQKLMLEQSEFRMPAVRDLLVDLLSLPAAEKGIGFRVDLPMSLETRALVGDVKRLCQVALNLASNAVKFTDAGAVQVVVRVEHDLEHEVQLRFEVRDTGVGIAPEDQALLFQEFSQVDPSLTRRSGGTGLGLAISKRLVELMQGQIGVDSAVGRGSTFWFTARFSTV